MTKVYTGGCACGVVRYQAAALPLLSLHCQYRDCQRMTGTGHASMMVFPAATAAIPLAARAGNTSPVTRARAHARGHSSASKWTGTRVPRNAGFPPMNLPINRSLVGARVERISSARAPEMCLF